MQRRTIGLIVALVLGLLAAPRASAPPSVGNVPRIGCLGLARLLRLPPCSRLSGRGSAPWAMSRARPLASSTDLQKGSTSGSPPSRQSSSISRWTSLWRCRRSRPARPNGRPPRFRSSCEPRAMRWRTAWWIAWHGPAGIRWGCPATPRSSAPSNWSFCPGSAVRMQGRSMCSTVESQGRGQGAE
jgi:hypothetical protein